MTSATYYIWKWADNDVAGKPTTIVREFCAGRFPRALATFPPLLVQPAVEKKLASECRQMDEAIVHWQTDCDGNLRFGHIAAVVANPSQFGEQLLATIWSENLTLYDEANNRLLGLPKRLLIEMADGRQLVDVSERELPVVLRQLDARCGCHALACYDRWGNMFQAWEAERRFAVEWQALPERDFSRHRIWLAGLPPQTRQWRRWSSGLRVFGHEALSFGATLRLWRSFVECPQRPAAYTWREITQLLRSPTTSPRLRHKFQIERVPPTA